MGRAGGGGGGRAGGGRSGGGSFSRGGGGGRSFSGGGGRPGGSFGGHSGFGGPSHHGPMHRGSMHHGPMHHGPMHHRPYYHHHHHHYGGFLFGPWFWGPRYGRTVIINNGGGNGGYAGGTYSSQNTQGTAGYSEPQPMTVDQKIRQAEKFQQEAVDGKKKAIKILAVAAVIFALGLLMSFISKQNAYEMAELSGTVNAGYAYDDGFTYNGGKTEKACKYFYEKTGIPLFFYTLGDYDGEASTCDDYTMQLYDTLFQDENHVLVAYYDNVDWWSWAIGENAVSYMGNSEVNVLIDTIYLSWDNYSLSNDAVLARGIQAYADDITRGDQDTQFFAVFLYIVGGVVAIVAAISYANNNKEEKFFEEEIEKLRMEKMRGA